MIRLVSLQEEERPEHALSLPCEDTVRRQLSASQEWNTHWGIELASPLILNFPAPRTVGNKFLLVKALS